MGSGLDPDRIKFRPTVEDDRGFRVGKCANGRTPAGRSWRGKLQPQLTLIQDISGLFAFSTMVTYRFTDNFSGSINYLALAASRKAGLGALRAHDTCSSA